MTGRERLRERYLAELRAAGALTAPTLTDAFRSVPREVFVAGGFLRSGDHWARPGDPDFLDKVYRNTVLVTRVRDGMPASSSSQPSLMAAMLAALDLAPGCRVLEIGAGTGYNAALMAALGAEVVSVDVQDDVALAAAAALAEAGVTTARVICGDGYVGAPPGPFDRIIATVGINGLSAEWPGQLASGGLIVAPVAHGGLHPVLAVRAARAGMLAVPVCAAGFMTAAGPLTATFQGLHPPEVRDGPGEPSVVLPALWSAELDFEAYHDLWFAAAAWDRRVTSVPSVGPELLGGCGLVLGGGAGPDSVAAVLPDGRVFASGPIARFAAEELAGLAVRWVRAGSPAMNAWSGHLALTGEVRRPIWAPHSWFLDVPGG